MSNSLLYGFIAFLGVLFAGAVLVAASKQQGSNKTVMRIIPMIMITKKMMKMKDVGSRKEELRMMDIMIMLMIMKMSPIESIWIYSIE